MEDQQPSINYRSIRKQVEKIYNFCINKGSTTISKESTLQANGNGKGEPLTGKAEGEDIVSSIQ